MDGEIRTKPGLADYYRRVLEDAGVSPQQLTRFAHIVRKEPAAALVAIIAIEAGAEVGVVIERIEEGMR
jgi:hypothetical protein